MAEDFNKYAVYCPDIQGAWTYPTKEIANEMLELDKSVHCSDQHVIIKVTKGYVPQKRGI